MYPYYPLAADTSTNFQVSIPAPHSLPKERRGVRVSHTLFSRTLRISFGTNLISTLYMQRLSELIIRARLK